MDKNFVNLIDINKNEVLRYLEYKGQDIDNNLNSTIDECIQLTRKVINPRYILRVYPISRDKENIVELEGTNLKLESKELYNLLKDCDECILMASTLGVDVEKYIRKYSYMNLTKGIIIDSCATTSIEELCDSIQLDIEEELLKENKNITSRYSPGYGDLSIEKNIDIINVLNAHKEIGLSITSNGIMIPRKSVVAIIGVSKRVINKKSKSCSNCKNNKTCKYRKEVDGCGYKGIHRG